MISPKDYARIVREYVLLFGLHPTMNIYLVEFIQVYSADHRCAVENWTEQDLFNLLTICAQSLQEEIRANGFLHNTSAKIYMAEGGSNAP